MESGGRSLRTGGEAGVLGGELFVEGGGLVESGELGGQGFTVAALLRRGESDDANGTGIDVEVDGSASQLERSGGVTGGQCNLGVRGQNVERPEVDVIGRQSNR